MSELKHREELLWSFSQQLSHYFSANYNHRMGSTETRFLDEEKNVLARMDTPIALDWIVNRLWYSDEVDISSATHVEIRTI